MPELRESTCRSLRRILLERQSEHRVPGVYGAVVRDGDLVWGDGVGSADRDSPGVPPSGDSQFLIASVSKTFTAVMIMALRDEGRLSLDDPVERHIPDSTHQGVTIRQMLAHSTGMQREPLGDVWDTLTFPDRAELVAGWNEAERVLRPHHRWHYSNLVFSMLGEVVARLDRRAWEESLRTRILEPLGMGRTTVGLEGAAATGYYVPPYTDVPVREPVLDIGALVPAGGLASTARDLATWAAFLAEPDPAVLAPDTVEEMCQPQIVADLERWEMAWGLGLMLLRVGASVYVGHPGAMPGHITAVLVDRTTRTGAVALMNATSAPDSVEVASALASYVAEHEPVEPDPWVPGTTVPAELTGILGRWFSEGRSFTFSVRQGRLEARVDAAPSHQPPSVFEPVGADLYRTESGRETGELLRVSRDADGGVTRLNWATYLFSREPYAFGEWL